MRYSGLTIEELKWLEHSYETKRACAQIYQNLKFSIPEVNVIHNCNESIKLIRKQIKHNMKQ